MRSREQEVSLQLFQLPDETPQKLCPLLGSCPAKELGLKTCRRPEHLLPRNRRKVRCWRPELGDAMFRMCHVAKMLLSLP